jgi:hypothetical protein
VAILTELRTSDPDLARGEAADITPIWAMEDQTLHVAARQDGVGDVVLDIMIRDKVPALRLNPPVGDDEGWVVRTSGSSRAQVTLVDGKVHVVNPA